ncbi:hypothetical protein ACH4OY_27270 [Micromonospora rubida]|uniref:Glycosyltransferase subfamily 4-like N-terminal domain-containing protein n=1 Tax=Micromonospora rubida TaxID=2697657 RepID=A0ABW7SRP7_9ACTN
MIEVLMVTGNVPGRIAVLTDALAKFRAAGARVRIASTFEPELIPGVEGLAELHMLPVTADLPPRVRRKLARASPARRPWLRAQHDPWVRRYARQADILVALDGRALHTVWQLAHRHRRSDAVYGIAPALRAVERRSADLDRYRQRRLGSTGPSSVLVVATARDQTMDVAKAVLQTVTGRRAMRSGAVRWLWERAVVAPGLPERYRAEVARRVQTSMHRVGHPASATRVAVAASSKVSDPAVKAKLLSPLSETQPVEGDPSEQLSPEVTDDVTTGSAPGTP